MNNHQLLIKMLKNCKLILLLVMKKQQLVFLVDNKVCMMQSLSCHWQLTRLMSFFPSCYPFVAVVIQLITQHLLKPANSHTLDGSLDLTLLYQYNNTWLYNLDQTRLLVRSSTKRCQPEKIETRFKRLLTLRNIKKRALPTPSQNHQINRMYSKNFPPKRPKIGQNRCEKCTTNNCPYIK